MWPRAVLFLFGGYVLRELLAMHDVPLDSPTFFLCMWNFAAVGTLLVFWTEYGCGPSPPLQLQQSYLISKLFGRGGPCCAAERARAC